MSKTDELATARAIADRGGIAPPGLLVWLADRVEALEGLLLDLQWKQTVHRQYGDVVGCGWCKSPHYMGHAPNCRLAAALGKGEASDGR